MLPADRDTWPARRAQDPISRLVRDTMITGRPVQHDCHHTHATDHDIWPAHDALSTTTMRRREARATGYPEVCDCAVNEKSGARAVGYLWCVTV